MKTNFFNFFTIFFRKDYFVLMLVWIRLFLTKNTLKFDFFIVRMNNY